MEIPVVDISSGEKEVMERLKMAATTVGFFRVVNHGVPQSLMETMLNAARKFHEFQEKDKSRYKNGGIGIEEGRSKLPVVVPKNGSVTYITKAVEGANHVNSLVASEPFGFTGNSLPDNLEDVIMEYSQHMKKLGSFVFELLSVALELKKETLIDIACAKRHGLVLHYYPPADYTIGLSSHADRSFLTILLQDQIGGLEVLHQGRWFNIHPVSGAFIVNIGDLMKLISNDKFVSSQHRVWANEAQARVSVACFFIGDSSSSSKKMYGPLKELVSDTNPPVYRDTTIKDYMINSRPSGIDGTSTLEHLKI